MAFSSGEPLSGTCFLHHQLYGDVALNRAVAMDLEAAPKSLLFPWISHREGLFESVLAVNNYGEELLEISMTARRGNGETETVTRTVPARGFLLESAGDLFQGMGEGDGYSVSVEAGTLSGVWLTYSPRSDSGASPAMGGAVSLDNHGLTLLYGYLPMLGDLRSVPVLINTGTRTGKATLSLISPEGLPVSGEPLLLEALEPFRPITLPLDELFPQISGNYQLLVRSLGEPLAGAAFIFNTKFMEPAIGDCAILP